MFLSDFFKRDNNNLDLIRLILAAVVIIGHVPAFKIVAPDYIDFMHKVFPFTYSGALAVKAFFFISGLLVTNSILSRGNWKTYIVSRCCRIYPALIFASVLIVLVCFFITTSTNGEYIKSAIRYLRKIITMNFEYHLEGVSFISETTPAGGKCSTTVNGSIWTIPSEVKMYVSLLGIYLIVVALGLKKISMFIIFSLLSLSPLLLSTPLMGGGTNEEVTFLLSPFFAGSALVVFKDQVNINWQLIVGCALLYNVVKNEEIRHWICYVAVPLALVWLSTLPVIRKIKIKKDISYGVYVWGWFVQVYVQYLFPHLSHFMYVVVCMLVVIPIAILSAIFIEEPFIKLGKKINARLV